MLADLDPLPSKEVIELGVWRLAPVCYALFNHRRTNLRVSGFPDRPYWTRHAENAFQLA